MKTRISPLALICLTATAHAGWTVKVLHPAGATSSQAYCTDGVTVGGQVDGRAAIWNINSGAVTYLSAPGSEGVVYTLRGGIQGGKTGTTGMNQKAWIWKGSAASGLDVTSAGDRGTGNKAEIFAMNSNSFGGYAIGSNFEFGQAQRWNLDGTDRGIYNAGVVDSQIRGMSETDAVGAFSNGPGSRAARWDLATGTLTDLHPAGVSGESQALATANGVQVGFVGNRAALWRGTKESYVDLTPAGATGKLVGTTGDYHVGVWEFSNGTGTGAGLWHINASDRTDLAQLLPSGYAFTNATSIYRVGNLLSVSGWTYNSSRGKLEAVVWTAPVPEPTSIAVMMVGIVVLTRRSSNQCYRSSRK